MRKSNLSKLMNDKGVTAIIVALLLVVFIGIAALAVDIGYVAMAKNQSQNAADAAALAGARQLGENYDTANPATTNVDSVAQSTAQANKVAGEQLTSGNIAVKIGIWGTTETEPTPHFIEGSLYPTAVQVTTNATFNSFFARIFGKSNLGTGAIATAALFGPCNVTPTIPLGVSTGWFKKNPGVEWCGKEIILGDTQDSCAGWTNLDDAKFKQKDVQDMLEGKTPMLEVHSGEYIEFGGGTIEVILEDLLTLFKAQRGLDDDGDPSTWTTSVVVYEGGCENPVTPYMVKGTTTIIISDVRAASNSEEWKEKGLKLGLTAKVKCIVSVDEREGCFNAGTLGKYPRLVK